MTKEDYELLCEMMKQEKKGGTVEVRPPPVAVKMLEDVCTRTGLDWKTRNVYLLQRGSKWQVQLSIDGFRLIAATDSDYNGQSGPFWTLGPEQPWSDIPPDKAPYAAKVGVYRKGQQEPTWGVAKFADYNAGSFIWSKFPSTMVAKCAEALALRKALPGKLSGLYTSDEMAQADKEGKREKAAEGGGAPVIAPPDPGVPTNYGEQITSASSWDELLTIGKTISASHLGVDEKMRLSKQYQAKKAEKGWG